MAERTDGAPGGGRDLQKAVYCVARGTQLLVKRLSGNRRADLARGSVTCGSRGIRCEARREPVTVTKRQEP